MRGPPKRRQDLSLASGILAHHVAAFLTALGTLLIGVTGLIHIIR